MLLASQLQPPPGGQVDIAGLADSGGDAGGSQRILQRRQSLRLVANAHLDQLLGGKV